MTLPVVQLPNLGPDLKISPLLLLLLLLLLLHF